jgi:hypothetical protein
VATRKHNEIQRDEQQSNPYHFINLLQGAIFDFRKEEIHPYGADDARWKPDVSVFGTVYWSAVDAHFVSLILTPSLVHQD